MMNLNCFVDFIFVAVFQSCGRTIAYTYLLKLAFSLVIEKTQFKEELFGYNQCIKNQIIHIIMINLFHPPLFYLFNNAVSIEPFFIYHLECQNASIIDIQLLH